MVKLNPKSQKVLRITHIFFVCLWIGGAVTLPLMKLGLHPDEGHILYEFDITRKFIDDFIVVPGAIAECRGQVALLHRTVRS